jgi:hypothetical protein
MRTFGYALLFAGAVGGLVFLLNLMSGMAREKCQRVCPSDPTMLLTRFDFGFVKYIECRCN